MTHACERTHKKDLCWMIVQYLLSCALTSLRVLRPRPCRTLELPRALARTADCRLQRNSSAARAETKPCAGRA